MKITVVTATYNSQLTIADALASVDSQRGVEVEHLIIDGSSTDRTLEIIRGSGRPWRRLVSEPDRGIYHAMNKGLALATGEVVGFLNSDDLYADESALSRVAAAFLDTHVDAVFGDLVLVDAEDVSRIVRYWNAEPPPTRSASAIWVPPHPSFFVRRSVYASSGGFDESFRISADFEMALRLLHVQRITARHIASVLVRMRMGGTSTRSFSSVLKGNLEASRACRKHGLPSGAPFILKKIMSKLPQLMKRPGSHAP